LPGKHNLTGFSHGTAGVGYALYELGLMTNNPTYLRAAESAFNYERHWFSVEESNWPDFREHLVRSTRNQGSLLPYATYWCHGAPGIALSRLRAYKTLDSDVCRNEAEIALQTTHRSVEASLQAGNSNYSLCHGLTGNAAVLLYGYQVLGQQTADDLMLTRQVANNGVRQHGSRPESWPCGASAGETPGLFLGLAGIGHFYLRLWDPTIPSILLLEREQILKRLSDKVL
jgi:lantibiotic modifying enzyme